MRGPPVLGLACIVAVPVLFLLGAVMFGLAADLRDDDVLAVFALGAFLYGFVLLVRSVVWSVRTLRKG